VNPHDDHPEPAAADTPRETLSASGDDPRAVAVYDEDVAQAGTAQAVHDAPDRRNDRDHDDDGPDGGEHPWIKRGLQALIGLGVLGLFVLLAMFLMRQKTAPAMIDDASRSPAVEVVVAERATVPTTIRGFGPIRARSRLEITPQVDGRIVQVHPDLVPGGVLRGGSTVVRIDATDFEQQLQRAQADLSAARANRRTVESTRESAEAEVASARQAVETAEARSAVAIENYEQTFPGEPVPELVARLPQLREARARLASALASRDDVQSRLAEADAQIEAARAAVDSAQTELERSTLRLPGDADDRYRVASEDVAVGRYVSSRQPNPVAVLYRVDALEASVPLEPAEIALLNVPQPEARDIGSADDDFPVVQGGASATLRSEGRTWAGRVVRVEGEVDPRTRLTNVEVTIDGETVDEVYPLPARALRPIERGPTDGGGRSGFRVWVDADGKLAFREVELVRRAGGVVYVRGLADGDRVVVTDIEAATEGLAINVTGTLDGPQVATRDERESQPQDSRRDDALLQAVLELQREVRELKESRRVGFSPPSDSPSADASEDAETGRWAEAHPTSEDAQQVLERAEEALDE
jgi:hypothetical protein